VFADELASQGAVSDEAGPTAAGGYAQARAAGGRYFQQQQRVGGKAKHLTDDDANHPAMGDDEQIGVIAGQQLLPAMADAFAKVGEGFGIGRVVAKRIGPEPGQVFDGDLIRPQAFPGAEAAFAKVRHRCRWQLAQRRQFLGEGGAAQRRGVQDAIPAGLARGRIGGDGGAHLPPALLRQRVVVAAAKAATALHLAMAQQVPESRVCARDSRRVDPSPPGLAQGDGFLCPGSPCGRSRTRLPVGPPGTTAPTNGLTASRMRSAYCLRGFGTTAPAPLRQYARAYAYPGLRAFASLSMARSG